MIYCITSKSCFPRDFMGKHFVPNLCYCKKVTRYCDKCIYQSYLKAQAAQISNDLGNKSSIPELVLTWREVVTSRLTLDSNWLSKLTSSNPKNLRSHAGIPKLNYRSSTSPAFMCMKNIRSTSFFMGKDSFKTEHMIKIRGSQPQTTDQYQSVAC